MSASNPKIAAGLAVALAAGAAGVGLWSHGPDTAQGTEVILSLDGGLRHSILLAAGPTPDAGDAGWPSGVVAVLGSYEVPRGDLPDGLTVEVWPEGTHWGCACAPRDAGVEELRHAMGQTADEWRAAPRATVMRRGRFRGDTRPTPCDEWQDIQPRGYSRHPDCLELTGPDAGAPDAEILP